MKNKEKYYSAHFILSIKINTKKIQNGKKKYLSFCAFGGNT